MEIKTFNRHLRDWMCRNAAALLLVVLFIVIYIISQNTTGAIGAFGNTGLTSLGREYYRWITCLFLHNNPRHLLTNSAAMLSVSSLLSRRVKYGRLCFVFLVGGVLSEIAYSVIAFDPAYEIGASGGIFALIAFLVVCCLAFPEYRGLRWYRPDSLIVMVYFILANSSITAFLVHTFGFAAGIILGFIIMLPGKHFKRQ